MKKGIGVVPKFFSKLNFKYLVNVSIGSLIIIQIFFITGSTTNIMNLVDSSFQKTITITLSVVSLLIAFSLIISFRVTMESMNDILKGAEKISEGKLNISDIIILPYCFLLKIPKKLLPLYPIHLIKYLQVWT